MTGNEHFGLLFLDRSHSGCTSSLLPPALDTFPKKLVNIIFVHGLGGSARGTWTPAQAQVCWLEWIKDDKELQNVQIATFGYDASWKKIWVSRTVLGIADFAEQLFHGLSVERLRKVDFVHLLTFRYPLYLLHTAWEGWL
jgi:hypothetical protein